MEVENVSRKSLASRWAPQQEGKLSIGHCLFGKVVINAEHMLALVPEVFPHADSRIGRQKLKRGRFRSCRGNHNRIIHRSIFLESGNEFGHRRTFLTDTDIDADHITGFLIDDRVHRNCGFSCLTVPNDQFTLSASDRNHRINRFESGLEGFMDRFAGDNSRCNDFYPSIF